MSVAEWMASDRRLTLPVNTAAANLRSVRTTLYATLMPAARFFNRASKKLASMFAANCLNYGISGVAAEVSTGGRPL